MNNAKLFSDEAANIYERAISTLLKKNMLLYFAYADYEEVSKTIFRTFYNWIFYCRTEFFFLAASLPRTLLLVDKDDTK